MSIHKAEISSVTTLWLLPVVSTIVCAATGGMVAGILTDSTHALWTLVVSYVLWGIGVPLAMFTLVLYYHRLAIHKIPPREVISSVFLPLGPLGEGRFHEDNPSFIDSLPRDEYSHTFDWPDYVCIWLLSCSTDVGLWACMAVLGLGFFWENKVSV